MTSYIISLPSTLQHGAVRMTSSSQKIFTNEATGPNTSSEESDRKGRTKPHPKIRLPSFEKKDHTRSETMVEKFHTIHQNDSRGRPKQLDN